MGLDTANAADKKHEKKLRVTAFIASLLIYLVLIGINLDPAVTKAQVGVAGEHPFGIPTRAFFMGLHAILFFPIFWWSPQIMKLQAYASQEDRSLVSILLSSAFTLLELLSLFTSVRDEKPPEIRRARNITFLGFLYFAALGALWIVLSARAGV